MGAIKKVWDCAHMGRYNKYLLFRAIPVNLLLWGCKTWSLRQTLLVKLEVFLHRSLFFTALSALSIHPLGGISNSRKVYSWVIPPADKLAWVMETESKAVEIVSAAAKVIRTFLQHYLSVRCYIFRIPDEKDDGNALELYRARLDKCIVYSACTSTSVVGEALAIDSGFNLKTGHVDGEEEVVTGSSKLTLRKVLMETKVPGTDKKVLIVVQLYQGRVLVFFSNKSTHETEVLKICKVGPWCMWILSSRYSVIPSEIERVMRKMFSSTTCMLALTLSH